MEKLINFLVKTGYSIDNESVEVVLQYVDDIIWNYYRSLEVSPEFITKSSLESLMLSHFSLRGSMKRLEEEKTNIFQDFLKRKAEEIDEETMQNLKIFQQIKELCNENI